MQRKWTENYLHEPKCEILKCINYSSNRDKKGETKDLFEDEYCNILNSF